MTDDTHQLPRGLRNNNPGNIRALPSVKWQGQDDVDDDGFVIFKTSFCGLRAMAEVLHHYVVNDDTTTVSEIINRYAPPEENNTKAYIDAVCSVGGCRGDTIIDLPVDAGYLMFSMISVENGRCPWTPDFLLQLYNNLYTTPPTEKKD